MAPPAGKPTLCRAEAVVPRSGGWHLTERGLAVVLVLVAALVVASLAVVGLTALRVTGESYHPGSGAASRPLAQP